MSEYTGVDGVSSRLCSKLPRMRGRNSPFIDRADLEQSVLAELTDQSPENSDDSILCSIYRYRNY